MFWMLVRTFFMKGEAIIANTAWKHCDAAISGGKMTTWKLPCVTTE
jgi:hypothetical protein